MSSFQEKLERSPFYTPLFAEGVKYFFHWLAPFDLEGGFSVILDSFLQGKCSSNNEVQKRDDLPTTH